MPEMTQQEKTEIIDDALNAAIGLIQDRIGVDDGGHASIFFSSFGHQYEAISEVLSDYIDSELEHE